MSTSTFPLAKQAENILLKQFARLRKPTKKIATFQTKTGRHIALALERKNDIYIWAEFCPEITNGIEIRNRKFPGEPYSTDQSRSSNLPSASKKLMAGNQTYYLKFPTLGAVEKFTQWYSNI